MGIFDWLLGSKCAGCGQRGRAEKHLDQGMGTRLLCHQCRDKSQEERKRKEEERRTEEERKRREQEDKAQAEKESKRSSFLAPLTHEEKREVLDLNDFYLQSVLDARKGEVRLVDSGTNGRLVAKLSEDDIKQAIQIVRLQKKALAAAEAGNRREAIKLFEAIIAKAPFDSISMMSIGVQYAQLQDGRKAVQYLERVLKSDPANQRIRGNLEAIREDFGL